MADELNLPPMIDVDNETKREFVKLNDNTIDSVDIPETASFAASEYTGDAYDLVIKSTIINQINIIQDMSSFEDAVDIHQMMNILKNMLIIHGRDIHRMQFTDIIEQEITCLDLNYSRFVLHKMLNNIRRKKFIENLGFREINKVISSMPPIAPELRAAIEQKLPMFRRSRQIKKTLKPFRVDQVVGAKDKENKWWLARILHAHNTPNSPDMWYYVHFEGWGHSADEWIHSRTYRVRDFNPRRHFLKRG